MGSDGKESACNAGYQGLNPWVGKIPWRREWQPTPVFLPGESRGQRYSPWGRKKLDTTEQITLSLSYSRKKKERNHSGTKKENPDFFTYKLCDLDKLVLWMKSFILFT